MNSELFQVFSDTESEDEKPKVPMKRSKQSKQKKKVLNTLQPKVSELYEQEVEKQYSLSNHLTSKPEAAAAGAEEVKEEEEDGAIKVQHKVRHQVALPADYDYTPIHLDKPNPNPPRKYKFQLDPFQQTAINAIERNESCLVSAHTSAGKTVVAEYAIATALSKKQRVIYTSPIKALSNQKYRDLLQEFGDVGLMTGDVTINEDATCLVMTTEILRSMLYRGSEICREMGWVIFDEIHYMRDAVRGVVWEETLIMLPAKVHYVFLSATIPNAMQFAEWICKIKEQPCHVVYTDYRPTPLQHYLFPENGDGIHLVVDEKSNFRQDNFQKAIGALVDVQDPQKKWNHKKQKEKSDLFKIIKMINAKNYHPVIVFSFSKKECENNALQLSKLDFNTEDEKDTVKKIYVNAIQSLNEDDRQLPQIEHLLPLLTRGIGIHHSGLLPILKEVIEILFQEGLLKILFATETFSIGLNMPAKTVIFTSVRKFDGIEQRWLSGGEYIQMSGRAGRRGLDDRGIVILMIDQKMEPHIAQGMLKGVSDSLDSAFHLTYTMILNLGRVDGVTPEMMLSSSFHQYQNSTKIPDLEREISIYERRLDAIDIPNEETVADYYNLKQQLQIYEQDVRNVINAPTYVLPFLQPGRLIKITVSKDNSAPLEYGWGVVINFQKTFVKKAGALKNEDDVGYILDVFLNCDESSTDDQPLPSKNDKKGVGIIVACSLTSIDSVSTVRLNTPKELKTAESRNQVRKTLLEVQSRFKHKLPLLDPIKDMKITDSSFTKLLQKIVIVKEKLDSNALNQDDNLMDLYQSYQQKVDLVEKIKDLKKQITTAESVLQMDELKCRRRVLRRLEYTNELDVIQVKGRVACEISAGDELLITEMMFNGLFNELSVEQTNAVLSCFTFTETAKEVILKPELNKPFLALREHAKRIAAVSIECKIAMDADKYVDSFKKELMPVVYAWSLGAKFSQITKLTEVFEGSIIRSIRRLEELLRQLIVASTNIGNIELQEKFEQCNV